MSTTQRSEGMNAFFEDYVNSKTTLKQFVDQYDSALRRKVENEAIADFNSFSTKIPCITRYPLEKQFQKAYTIAKFKEVQEELRGLIYLTTTFLGCEGARYKCVVADEVQVSDNFLKCVNFTVEVDEDPLDVKCSCKLFEFRGILCRHTLRILTQLGKDTIPSKYILDRWKKDVKRKCIFVKSSYDTSSIDDTRRYDRIQNAFYELCYNASKAESRCVKLISQIEQLKVQYPGIVDCDTSTTVDPVTSMEGTTGRVLSSLRSSRASYECIVSGTQQEAPQTQDQQSQIWTHVPDFFSTPSIATDYFGTEGTASPSQYTPHQAYTRDNFGIGQIAPPSQDTTDQDTLRRLFILD
ncbi:protein FAR-RED IMPAIRED RESPONSE 1-like [Carya illinoinensis]|uniref:protein FAR-RED IMPAIRED RESPONSE 1-like n=1 Tax=Carya illinoinensis TaxID=32201 RepID=UPI001C726CBC|nr:protein FAR-RED IMPAIRED RESPONSE 1-like [Carya illinoinensis]